MVRRVIEVVVQSDVLTISQRLMVGCLMNVFAFDRASLQIKVMLDVCLLSGVPVGVMIRAEGNPQDLGQVRCLGRVAAGG
jgi:hypothetical protein